MISLVSNCLRLRSANEDTAVLPMSAADQARGDKRTFREGVLNFFPIFCHLGRRGWHLSRV